MGSRKVNQEVKSFLTIFCVCFLMSCNDSISTEKVYSNGKLLELINFKDNVMHGERIVYYTNGNIRIRENYLDGRLSGKKYLFFDNGKTEAIYSLVNGKEDGKYIEFYRNGSKKIEATYRNGRLDGLFKEFYVEGKLKVLSNYEEGKLNGPIQYFSEDGDLTLDAYALNGVTLHFVEYNSKGQIIEEFTSLVVENLTGHSIALGEMIKANVFFYGNSTRHRVYFNVENEFIPKTDLDLKNGKLLIEFKPLKKGKKIFYVFASKIDSPLVARVDTFHFTVR